MTLVKIVDTEPLHVAAICATMRERERQGFDDVAERYGVSPERLLAQQVANSLICKTGLYDGTPALVYGAQVASILSDTAYIWMVATPIVVQHASTFLRHSRAAVRELGRGFRVLNGLVVVDFRDSHRWLSWLGFTIEPAVDGICRFEMKV